MTGDATLFLRSDEVETAWSIVDPIGQAWNGQPLGNREFYAAGTWGPTAAEELLTRDAQAWRDPQPAV
jgi:glucose-6-phosphate 1-dehydrogenase